VQLQDLGINKSINLGFTFIPGASSKSKYSDDFSTSNFRKGNGMIIGGPTSGMDSNNHAGAALTDRLRSPGRWCRIKCSVT
jgi:hypothetical protein